MFKVKNKKIFVADQRVTLEARHSDFIKKFKTEESKLPEINKEIEIIKNKLEEYNIKGYDNLSNEESWDNLEKKNRLDELNIMKNNIKNNLDINDYFLKTGNILFNYFDDIENTASNENILKDKKKSSKNKKEELIPIQSKNNILNFFQNYDNNNNDNNNEELDSPTNNKNNKSLKIDSNNESENHHSNMENNSNNRAELLNKYLTLVDNTYCNFDKITTEKMVDFCQICFKKNGKKIEKVLIPNEGISVCDNCGDLTHIVIDSDKPSYKDPPPEATYFAYKKINHLNEWLNQIQALESTDIPEEIYEKIWEEIKKERIEDLSKLNYKKIRDYLKKLRLNKYYEHIPHILYKLNGLPAPKLTNEVVEVLRAMFREIQGPFNEICPPDRKNFLSYSYTLHKFVELLGLNEYKLLFPLLKSREKLHQQDIMWKKICEKVGWEFIKSI
jgi:hypothetical protein